MEDSKIFKRWASKLAVSLLELFIFLAIELRPGQLYSRDLLNMGRAHLSPTIKVPTLYALLNRCEEHGLLQVDERHIDDDDVEVKTRGQARKYYELTPAGEEYLKAMKTEVQSQEALLSFDIEDLLAGLEEL